MGIFAKLINLIKETSNISDQIDRDAAVSTIRQAMSFKGPNVWILAFSIVIASVGLNLNSIPVIIGAMLISPLMGPIYGIGLALGTTDIPMLKHAFKNLFIMVVIALLASMIYFLVSPLNFANPTELEARTNPSIYDIIIALFGGLAGIFEMCRNQKTGTAAAGVAIATALMPPLCTVGYGLAKLNAHFFFGALLLFTINLVFISLATYFMVRYLKFPQADFADEQTAANTKKAIAWVVAIIMIPSIWSAYNMIIFNNFEQRVSEFVLENRNMERSYIYDYNIDYKNGRHVTLHMGGEALKAEEKAALLTSAEQLGLKVDQITLHEHALGGDDADNTPELLLKGIYERNDAEINKKNEQIRDLENQLNSLKALEIPYTQIAREVKTQYPEIQEISLARGESVATDSLTSQKHLVVIATSKNTISSEKMNKLGEWFKARLNDSTVVVINIKPNAVK